MDVPYDEFRFMHLPTTIMKEPKYFAINNTNGDTIMVVRITEKNDRPMQRRPRLTNMKCVLPRHYQLAR